MRAAIAIGVLLAISTVTTAASAMCSQRGPTLSPAGGAILPGDPYLLLFVPAESFPVAVRVREAGTGAPIRSVLSAPTRSGSVIVHRLFIDAVERGVEVDVAGEISRYWLGPRNAPVPSHAAILGMKHVSDHWSCSYTEAAVLRGSGTAIGYRLEWQDRQGLHEAILEPFEVGGWADEPGSARALRESLAILVPQAFRLYLGHVSCLGHTVDARAFRADTEIRLSAIFVDGHEEVLGSATLRVDRIGTTLPRGLLGASCGDAGPLRSMRI